MKFWQILDYLNKSLAARYLVKLIAASLLIVEPILNS
jgi:hypothetical protein